ncbi:MAG: HAMP domain-containing sensor histidine kinase [Micrococcaceae bacterium]
MIYARFVNTLLIGAIAGLLGIIVGVIGILATRKSENLRRRVLEEPTISEGAAKVLSVLPQASIVVDATNDVERATPPAYTMGLVKSHTITIPEILNRLDRVRRDGVVDEFELERIDGAGKKQLFEIRIAPLDLDFLLIFAEDSTETRKMDIMRRDFINNISREIRGPVKSLKKISKKVNDNQLVTEVSHLDALTADVIQLSKLQNATVDSYDEIVDIDIVMRRAVADSEQKAKRHNIELKMVSNNPGECVGDEDLLTIAVKNIIDNAIAYSPENTSIGISAKQEAGYVNIMIIDRGIGLSEEDQERIFERFYQVSQDNTGTGLGLSIAKNVVSAHGGSINVWSRSGKGSTFTIKLPLVSDVVLAGSE